MSWAYVHIFWLTRPSCSAAGLVRICLSSLGLSYMSQGFCALVLAHWSAFYVTGLCMLVSAPCACSLHHGACVHLSWLCRPALYIAGRVFPSSSHQAHPLCCGASFGSLGPPSVPQGFCVLESFVCCASACWACPLCCGPSVGFSLVPKLTVWSRPWSMSCLWAEKCSFLCFLPFKSLLYLSF